MSLLRGLRDLIHDAIEKTTDLVQETHDAAAAKPIDLLSEIEPLAPAVRAVDSVRKLTADGVFNSIRATNRGVQLLEEAGLALARNLLGEALPKEAAEALIDAPTRARIADWSSHAQSALN